MMKLLEGKKIRIAGNDFSLRITVRAMIEYENLTGESISDMKGGQTEKLIKFFYVIAKAGARNEKMEFEYSYEEFLDIIDDHYLDFITNLYEAVFSPGGDDEKKKNPNP
jgi:hypothetical protein